MTKSKIVVDPSVKPTMIRGKQQIPLSFGGSWFVPYATSDSWDAEILDAMEAAYEAGVRHFDTGAKYGEGRSEEIFAKFAKGRRGELYLASKVDPDIPTADSMYEEVRGSLRRMQDDYIDLYYIHWPRTGRDMRPIMEGLERARRDGLIGAVGVSNFTVKLMEQVSQVGTIDANQLGYNLIWRYDEADVIPYCIANNIALVTYSSLAHGILTGKFEAKLNFEARDQRNTILPFRGDIWPHVYRGVEEMKKVAHDEGRSLQHIAIRWLMSRPGVSSVLIGARNRAQAEANMGALTGKVSQQALDRLTQISDGLVKYIPNVGNLFNHYP